MHSTFARLLFLVSLSSAIAQEAVSPLNFEDDIQPLLQENCHLLKTAKTDAVVRGRTVYLLGGGLVFRLIGRGGDHRRIMETGRLVT
jgi:hypothetical protein